MAEDLPVGQGSMKGLFKLEKDFCQKLSEAIADEQIAAEEYEKLRVNAVYAGHHKSAKEILEIQTDEKEHAAILTKIKEKLCK